MLQACWKNKIYEHLKYSELFPLDLHSHIIFINEVGLYSSLMNSSKNVLSSIKNKML